MAAVALIASSFFPRVGGVEEHVRNVAAELHGRGVDVVVWTADRGDVVPAFIDGVRVRVLPCPLPARNVRSLVSFAWRGPAAVFAWAAALRKDRPAILHVHCFGPNGVWGWMTARLTRRPLVITSHGETFGDADNVYDSSALLRASLRKALDDAAQVTVPSAYTARDLEGRFGLVPGRAGVVANGVDLDEQAGEAPAGLPERYILALGRLVGTKGFDLLIDAFALADLPADMHLVIGGSGPEHDELAALAAERGVADRVHLTGRLERGEVVAATAGATALAMPSRAEAFGIVLLEAWRAGVPVIATTRGGPRDFVRDDVDGWLVDPLDREALAASLRRVVDDPSHAASVGDAGRERVVEFTWQRIADQYEAIYRGLSTGPPASGAGTIGV